MNIIIATAAIVLVVTSLASGQKSIRIDPDDGCPPLWQNTDKYCYQFNTSPMTWSRANAKCRKSEASLVWVESAAEHRYLVENIKRRLGESTWIGYNDQKSEGKWEWSNPVTGINFVKWSDGEPNNKGNNEHCAAMWKKANYRWVDANCEKKLPFICKSRPVIS